MAVLRDDADRSERRCGTEDGSDIVRVRDLIEHEQHGAFGRFGKDIVEPDVLERFDLDHHPLVRRVVRNETAEVGDVGQRDLHLLAEIA